MLGWGLGGAGAGRWLAWRLRCASLPAKQFRCSYPCMPSLAPALFCLCLPCAEQVHEGASAQSYGLAVARFARLPPEVIEAAAKRMAELEQQPAGAAGGGGKGGQPLSAAGQQARELLLKFAQLPLEAGMQPEQLAVALQQHAIELCQ